MLIFQAKIISSSCLDTILKCSLNDHDQKSLPILNLCLYFKEINLILK